MSAITKEEFVSKYGDVLVRFERYYKYSFTYDAILPDGKRLTVDYGGCGDDIYRHEVERDESVTVLSLSPYAGKVYDGQIEIESFYDPY